MVGRMVGAMADAMVGARWLTAMVDAVVEGPASVTATMARKDARTHCGTRHRREVLQYGSAVSKTYGVPCSHGHSPKRYCGRFACTYRRWLANRDK